VKVLVCGDRNWTDRRVIDRQLRKLQPPLTIIHGAARGADTLAGEVAHHYNMEVCVYPAEWGRYGKAAGPIRNKQMLDEGKPDLVLAFHDNIQESKGTADMVKQAAKRGIETLVINHKRKEVSTPS